MLEVHDIRETRVYQEGLLEGMEKGMEKGKDEGLAIAITNMANKKKMSAEEIAAILEMNVDTVRQVLAKSVRN